MSHTKAEALTKAQKLFANAHKEYEELKPRIEAADESAAVRFHYLMGQEEAYRDAIGLIGVIENRHDLKQSLIEYAKGDYDIAIEEIDNPDEPMGQDWSDETKQLAKDELAQLRDTMAEHWIVDSAFKLAEQLFLDEMPQVIADQLKAIGLIVKD